jgi:hypothetical protein
MDWIENIKKSLRVRPVTIGDLNREAIGGRPPLRPEQPAKDPLAGIEMTEEFRTAKALVESGIPILLATGQAGTGKSTLIQVMRHTTPKNVVVVAPTGVSALNAQGSTIHSFFRFPPRIVTEDDLSDPGDRRLYSELGLLIVEEISMVRADLMDAMERHLRLHGPRRGIPFGGVQIVLVGDPFQLPPVVTKDEWEVLSKRYGSEFFFSARSLQTCELVHIELTKVYRQRDVRFMEMLRRLRVAEDVGPVLDDINARCFGRPDGDGSTITLACTNATADRLNVERLNELQGELRTFTGMTTGRFAVADAKLPSPRLLSLRTGAQIMFTKNDTIGRWVNGSLGRVVAIHENSIAVELVTDHPGETHMVSRESWEHYQYQFDEDEERVKPVVTGTFTQFPIMLAWAITVHKAQGKTLEKVRVDLGRGAFVAGQTYVALSRCRSLDDIALTRPIRTEEVKADPRIKRFFSALRDRERESGA